jgi:hypothetical protein
MASIAELESLAAKLQDAKAPSRDLDQTIATILGRLPSHPSMPPAWTASLEETLKLYQELLPGRPMELTDDPDNKRFFCTIKLYGTMPATPPYQIAAAATAPFAVLVAMVRTLIAVEIDYWS